MEKIRRPFERESTVWPKAQHVEMRLLLVEDERRFAHLLARRLDDAGYETALAFSGTEGLERAAHATTGHFAG
jgi:ActR/RegA family two-component response regulator